MILRTFGLVAALSAACACACGGAEAAAAHVRRAHAAGHGAARHLARARPVVAPGGHHVVEDHTGRKQIGKASVYSGRFANRRMADGKRFDPNAAIAASKSLPLGTVAKVTDLENGRTATVKVEDHGPFVKGRVMDLSPKAAREIGLTRKDGVAPVVVAPVTVPQPDGGVKLGAGAADAEGAVAEQARR